MLCANVLHRTCSNKKTLHFPSVLFCFSWGLTLARAFPSYACDFHNHENVDAFVRGDKPCV